MDDTDLAFLPVVDLISLLDRREVSSRDLLDLYLRRVEQHNPALNAIVTLDADRARERAAAADEARARGESWGPLHGLPITVKDVFETKGLRTTCAWEDLADYVPDHDAVLVKRLKDAGAVIFGKTNTPTLAADGHCSNALFGTTSNPWNLDYTPGGSSGGCGAAVASGMTSVSFGSDIAGSIRIPSAYCGLFGLKATFGVIPARGHIPPVPPQNQRVNDINVVGPLARDPRDLDLALSVLAGPETQEALAWRSELPPPPAKPLTEYRVAAWLDDPFCPVDASVKVPMQRAVDQLRSAGVTVDEAKPDFELADSHTLYRQLLSNALVQGEPMSHRDWLDADNQRQGFRDLWAAFFARFDVLICPIGPVMAPSHADRVPFPERRIVVNGESRPYGDVIVWTGLIGMSYLPATAVPAGLMDNGLPVGFQVVGPHLADRRTIDFAAKLSSLIGGFQRPPGY